MSRRATVAVAEKVQGAQRNSGPERLVTDSTNLWLTIHESTRACNTKYTGAIGRTRKKPPRRNSFATPENSAPCATARRATKRDRRNRNRSVGLASTSVMTTKGAAAARSWDLVRDGQLLTGYQLDRTRPLRGWGSRL